VFEDSGVIARNRVLGQMNVRRGGDDAADLAGAHQLDLESHEDAFVFHAQIFAHAVN